LPKNTSSQIISKQLLRSGTSIGANYIEAQGSSSKKDFTNFFHHSLKSANESKFWLAIIRDTNKGDKKKPKNC
jgi:four helix bundle protein